MIQDSKIEIEADEVRAAESLAVEVVDLNFPDLKEMQAWCQCLANPRRRSTTTSPSFVAEIPVAPHETIEAVGNQIECL